MNIEQLLGSITPEIYENLKYAAETGRWPNGHRLTPSQREHCLQAVIAYDHKHQDVTERVGYIDRDKKRAKDKRDWQEIRFEEKPNRDP